MADIERHHLHLLLIPPNLTHNVLKQMRRQKEKKDQVFLFFVAD